MPFVESRVKMNMSTVMTNMPDMLNAKMNNEQIKQIIKLNIEKKRKCIPATTGRQNFVNCLWFEE